MLVWPCVGHLAFLRPVSSFIKKGIKLWSWQHRVKNTFKKWYKLIWCIILFIISYGLTLNCTLLNFSTWNQWSSNISTKNCPQKVYTYFHNCSYVYFTSVLPIHGSTLDLQQGLGKTTPWLHFSSAAESLWIRPSLFRWNKNKQIQMALGFAATTRTYSGY